MSTLVGCLFLAPAVAWTGPDIEIVSPQGGGVLGSTTFEVNGTASNGSATVWTEDGFNGFPQGESNNTTVQWGSIQLDTLPLEGVFDGAARPGSSTAYILYWRSMPPAGVTMTVELFMMYDQMPANNTVVFEGYDYSMGGRMGTIRMLFVPDNGTLRFDYYTNPGGVWHSLLAPIPSAGEWHHIACQAGVGGAKFFVDGNLSGNNTLDDEVSDIDGMSLGSSDQVEPLEAAQVIVDEYRVSTVQRYSANFTPPNTTFTNDASTIVLDHLDGVTNGWSFGWVFDKLVDEGHFISGTFDAIAPIVHIDGAVLGSDTPNGTNVSMFVRWSSDPNMTGAVDWMPLDLQGTPDLPPADRYLQYMLFLNQTMGTTPTIVYVSVFYQGVTEVMVSIDGTTWLPANGTEAWHANLTADGEGIVTVYVAAYDVAGNVTIAAVTAIVDLTPPTGMMTLAGGAEYTGDRLVSVGLEADDTNPVVRMQVSEDPSFAGASWQPFKAMFDMELSDGDGEKTVYARVMDIAGHESTVMSDSIVLDTTPPEGTLTIDDGSGVALVPSVTVNLDVTDANGVIEARLGTPTGIDGRPWVPFKDSNAFGLGETEGLHTIVAEVRDPVGNVLRLTGDVLLDLSPPTVSVSLASGEDLVDVETVQAHVAASDVNGVVSMRYTTDQAGLPSATWVDFASILHLEAEEDGTFTVWVEVMDAGGRTAVAQDSVMVDTTAPAGSLAIDGGAAWVHDHEVTLTLEAWDDTSGVAYIRVSNTANFPGSLQLEPVTTMDWTLPAGDGERTVYYEIVDVAGHKTVISSAIVVDTIPPTGTITLPSMVKDREVTADLSWENAVEMWLSEDPQADGPWVPVQASYAFTLTAADGSKTVHARYRGMYGLMSDVLSATVTLDMTSPALTITAPTPDSVVDAKQVTLTGTVADTNGVAALQVSVDGGDWTTLPVQATWSTVVDLSSWGSHTINVRAEDSAGNVAEASTLVEAEEEETFIASGGSIALVLIVLILCVTLIVLVWMSKRREPPLEEE